MHRSRSFLSSVSKFFPKDKYDWKELEMVLGQDHDCLVLKLGLNEAKILQQPRHTSSSKSLFPTKVVSDLQQRLSLFDTIYHHRTQWAINDKKISNQKNYFIF